MADVRLRLLTSTDGKGVSLSASNLASDVELEIPGYSGKIAVIKDITDALEGFEVPVGGGGIGSGPSTTGNGLPPYVLGQEVLTPERWIDGKPIYRKVIDFGVLPNNTTKSMAHEVENISGLSRCAVISKTEQNNWVEVSSTHANSATTMIWIYVGLENVFVGTNYNAGVTWTTNYFLLEYTKTTDTAETPVAGVSGYNIQPTEYFTGNYRNGKPIFGIEVDCGALPNAATKEVAIPNYTSSFKYWINTTESYFHNPVISYVVSLPNVSNEQTGIANVSLFLKPGAIVINTFMNLLSYSETKIVLHYTKN